MPRARKVVKKENVESRRLIFTFDGYNYELLMELSEGKFRSVAEAVRFAVQLAAFLKKQIGEGYDEVLVRDPKTGRERILGITDRLS